MPNWRGGQRTDPLPRGSLRGTSLSTTPAFGSGAFLETMMTEAEQAYLDAIMALNAASYAALRAAKDTTALPNVNRLMLRGVARWCDFLVDAGLETAEDHQ